MSQGKYSPNLPRGKSYTFNCYGEVPAPWTKELADSGVVYDEKTMFADYDDEGFDSYGYSSFDSEGDYVFGSGVDRNGFTEDEYMCMDPDIFLGYFW